MADFHEINAISIILRQFNVKNMIIIGSSNKIVSDEILAYCKNNNTNYDYIDLDSCDEEDMIYKSSLSIIPNLPDYDAIFLNGDPNWYTVFNELTSIKDNNDHFPLVFVCHNIFPHKYRDSYIDPIVIPDDFRNEYSNNLPLKNDIFIQDKFYHADMENTQKNGVSTAINDFLVENNNISLMNIQLYGIAILYDNNSIDQFKLNKILDEIDTPGVNDDKFWHDFYFNQVIADYYLENHDLNDGRIIKELLNELTVKNDLINDYSNRIDIQDSEINFKNTQIKNFDSKFRRDELKFEYMESQLVNKDNEIRKLSHQLNLTNYRYDRLKNYFEKKEFDYINQLKQNIFLLDEKDSIILDQQEQLKINSQKLEDKNHELNSLKGIFYKNFSDYEVNNYNLSCLKEELLDKQLEIEYTKHNYIIRKILTPFSFLYLFFKSPTEISLNLKLYNTLKKSKLFDAGFYLRNNKDIRDGKWVNYFPLELHYICNGFYENRKFNKKSFKIKSKRELLNFLLNN